MEATSSTTTSTWTLRAESELRMEVDVTSGIPLVVVLRDGSAEVYGIEMAAGREYIFRDGDNIAVYTWYGCTLETSGGGERAVFYESERTPMVAYANTHAQLEARRDVALANGVYGPRVSSSLPSFVIIIITIIIIVRYW